MVALQADESPATEWINLGPNIQSVQLENKKYLEHNSPSTLNKFMTSWIAPSDASGNITFYFAANAVNNNGSQSGDGGTNSTFVMTEFVTSNNDFLDENITLYPNPASEIVYLKDNTLAIKYSIIDVIGRVVKTSNLNEHSAIDISNLKNGIYFVNLQYKGKSVSKKLIKI
jgi:hypothetical protein